ncbi:hypothetical protein MYXA107069_06120 [Myxococcus xanthus]|nr:hypothetical protein MyxoNM_22020 [Myxococcus xanthus]SDW76227.1 hypothetical protein SAMN05444383_103399 [Myxococcus xanthus]
MSGAGFPLPTMHAIRLSSAMSSLLESGPQTDTGYS